jgi:hypothetical protein
VLATRHTFDAKNRPSEMLVIIIIFWSTTILFSRLAAQSQLDGVRLIAQPTMWRGEVGGIRLRQKADGQATRLNMLCLYEVDANT